ncbi:MAG TPA: hypothetical protein VF541_09280 [Longimicrobium sp.]|jgi:hypothetical protein
MRKLRLELEQLTVDSFNAGEARGAGTVRARGDSEPEVCPQPIDDGGEVAITATWWRTCPNTCQGDTCYISCVTRCSCRTDPCDTCA